MDLQSALFFLCCPTAAAAQCCKKLLVDENELSRPCKKKRRPESCASSRSTIATPNSSPQYLRPRRLVDLCSSDGSDSRESSPGPPQRFRKLIDREKQTYPDGRTYTGQWEGEVRCGRGVERSQFGDFVYEGEFNKDRYEGVGKMWWSNGACYEGEMREGQKSGQGLEKYASGDEYIGRFVNDLPHGEGVYKSKDGSEIHGVFERGRLVKWEEDSE